MNCPGVSIVIPVYDRVRFIGESLESLCQERKVEMEVIVVDDGSTDGLFCSTGTVQPLTQQ